MRTRLLQLLTLLPLLGCQPEEGSTPTTPTEPDGPTTTASADMPGKLLFQTKCQGCHTVGGGDAIGPDLKGVSERRDADWIKRWMADPMGMQQNDPIGKELLAKYNNVPMPPQNLTDDEFTQIFAYIDAGGDGVVIDDGDISMTDEEFEKAKGIFFDRCSGCHGTLRAGATGPNIQPERTRQIGTTGLVNTLTHGTPGGMPAWGRLGILTDEEINLMARYLQNEVPDAPALTLEDAKAAWKLLVPVEDRPTEPQTRRNWENYFGVVLRDAGQVAIIDGDTKEKLAIIETGFAVHILRSSSSGRYFYSVGRDGRLTMIDLWTETPTMVAQGRGCLDARSVDGSKYEGYEDKYLIEGCYWPPQYVVYDGQTLEPLAVKKVEANTHDTNEKLDEVRVAAIVASHFDPIWVAAFKESGHVALIDYSKPDFPVTMIGAARFLHDGGWDHSKRYFMVAANMMNQMAIVDVKERKLVTVFETGNKPHPGRGANWKDPQYGWVNATTHIGEGYLSVYGADPEGSPDNAWKVVRRIETGTSGQLFVKTHDNSPWVWMDSPLSNEDEKTRQVCVYSKEKGVVEKCWTPFADGRAVHFEYNKDGTEVWVSGWKPEGELVVYNDKTLEEVARIKEDWLVTPTGKFNVYNTAHDVY